MPIWADPARGETVRLLADDDMTLVATFVAPAGIRPTAADFRMVQGTDPAHMARIAARDLPGVRLITRLDEAAALTEVVGATVASTAVHMVRDDLQRDPPPLRWAAPRLPPGLSLIGLDRPRDEIASAQLRAYPPDHPDYESTREAHAVGAFEALLAGDLMGPIYHDASALLVNRDDRIVGGLIVTLWEGIGEEWPGGPWGVELFRLSEAGPGPVGRGLLARAVTVAHLDGHGAIGLTASAANRATRVLYPRLGFEPRFHRVTLDLPGTWPARAQ
jgi:hypothetical protein